MKNKLVKDLAITLVIILGLMASVFLINIGIGMIFIIGFIVPGWVFILMLLVTVYRRYKKK